MRAPTGALTQLVERDVERQHLEQAVRRAAHGQPQLLVIKGAAGIGKTSLLEELRGFGIAEGMVARWSRGTPFEQALAWSAARQLLTQPVLDITPEERAQTPEFAASRALAVLGLGGEANGPVQRPQALHALYWLAVGLSTRSPLLLIVDDVQWADQESIGYLNYLGNRLEAQPILVAVAIRTGEPESQRPELDELERIPAVVTVTPRALSPGGSAELVGRLLGDQAGPDLRRRLHRLTAGNPFLLRELCRGFEPGGAPGAAMVEQAMITAVERVSISVLSRLKRYPILAARVAEAVAILGPLATLHRVSRLTGATDERVANAIGLLIEAEILEQGDHTVDFVHPLVGRAVYEHLTTPVRQVRHAQAAELLRDENAPAGEVASKLLHAAPMAEPWRVAQLRTAAGEALAVGAPAAATTYLRRALVEPPRQQEMCELLLELGTSELHHDPGAARGHFAKAHELAASTEALSGSALLLARSHALLGDFSFALTVLNQAVDKLDGADSSVRRQLDSARLVFARWDYGSQDCRHELFEDLRARANAGLDLDRDERANLAHELAARGEDLDTAADCARWAIRHSDAVSGTDAAFVLELMSVLVLCDLCGEAEEMALSAVREAEARGSNVDASAALTLATYCALRRGDIRKAIERAESALARDAGVWTTGAVAWLSEALAESGMTTRAQAVLRQHALDQDPFTRPGEPPLSYQHVVLLHHRARMRALANDRVQALEDFLLVGELAEGWRVGNPAVLDWRSRAASILITLERQDEAAELAHEELRLARRWGSASAVGTALRAAGSADPSSNGTYLLREAVEVHATSPTRLEHARSLVALGTRLRRERQLLEAREFFRQGLDLASRCGGVVVANQARDGLVAAGGKPRRDATQGAEALTSRERRIAQLAAEAMTNRQIAQELFVSPRTVEHHLRNIYRKLGIQGREGLTAALEARS